MVFAEEGVVLLFPRDRLHRRGRRGVSEPSSQDRPPYDDGGDFHHTSSNDGTDDASIAHARYERTDDDHAPLGPRPRTSGATGNEATRDGASTKGVTHSKVTVGGAAYALRRDEHHSAACSDHIHMAAHHTASWNGSNTETVECTIHAFRYRFVGNCDIYYDFHSSCDD